MKRICLPLLLLVAGCSHHHQKPNLPSSLVGIVQEIDAVVTQESIHTVVSLQDTDDGQLVTYQLCADSQMPLWNHIVVNISFIWDDDKGCYSIKDAYRMQELEYKR